MTRNTTATVAFLLVALTGALSAQESVQFPLHLKVDVDLVAVNATVVNSEGQFITGLEKENFEVFEDKVRQELISVSSEDVPVSVGIILDVSGSMKNELATAVQAAITFMKGGRYDDEYFLIEFADRPAVVADFTRDIGRIQVRAAFSRARGETALYDAVYKGLHKLNEGSNPKRALLLISDGEDNRSRYTYANVREYVKEKNIQMFAIGITDGWNAYEVGQGQELLRKLASLSGGNSFFPPSASDLENICRSIARELKNQYLLSYHSTNPHKDGEWRKIKVTAAYEKNKLTVRAKPGYYGPPREATPAKN
jgi:Ca-activated chloride channel family protein